MRLPAETVKVRTSVVLDDQLLARCRKETGIRTTQALIEHALRELLRHGRQKKVLELKGVVRWEGDLDGWRRGPE
ncbi:MAG: type II toxin-antitoxin system VapB family antitoxin [Candidatus Eisenbacteria bacterium]|nr:type II toxin-antitoxin system VapB family antitoxin [Candidatus Eisenbacteria bacterium]